jgi:spermidine synthase
MITVAERKSRFGAIKILKTKNTGSLIYAQGDSFQSEADANGISLVAYIHAIFALLKQARSKTVLMIGCGGGTLATMLSSISTVPTVVDIDPHAFLLARRYFQLPADIECRVADGCEFLLSHTGSFDAVVHDAFIAGHIPAHLKSAPFFSLVQRRLNPSGSVFVNVHVEDDRDDAADRMAREMAKVWPDVRILDRIGGTNRNAIVMAGGVLGLQKPMLEMRPAIDAREIVTELEAMQFRAPTESV